MKQLRIMAMAMLAVSVLFTACDKDDDDDDDTGVTPTTRSINLNIVPVIGDVPVALGTEYTLNGAQVEFSFLKFYISELALKNDADETLADNDGKVLLADTEGTSYVIGSTQDEHFHLLELSVGLNDDLNDNDPTIAEEPLNDPQMHWVWNPDAGYKFVRMEGMIDGAMFQYHAATDALFRSGMMVDAHSISVDDADDSIDLSLEVDLNHVFMGMSLEAGMKHGNVPFNRSMMDNFGSGMPFDLRSN